MNGVKKTSTFNKCIEKFLDLFPQHRQLKAEWKKQNIEICRVITERNNLKKKLRKEGK